MTSRDAPLRFLSQMAPTAAAAWATLGKAVFPGELSIATGNSVYRLHNGVFISRAKKPARSFDAPKAMRGMVLIGFLHQDEASDRWSLSPRWRPASRAVLWHVGGLDAAAFILTSRTASFTLEEPEPKPGPEPSPWMTRRPRLPFRRDAASDRATAELSHAAPTVDDTPSSSGIRGRVIADPLTELPR